MRRSTTLGPRAVHPRRHPAGGVFTGAGDIKTAERAAIYGGTGGSGGHQHKLEVPPGSELFDADRAGLRALDQLDPVAVRVDRGGRARVERLASLPSA